MQSFLASCFLRFSQSTVWQACILPIQEGIWGICNHLNVWSDGHSQTARYWITKTLNENHSAKLWSFLWFWGACICTRSNLTKSVLFIQCFFICLFVFLYLHSVHGGSPTGEEGACGTKACWFFSDTLRVQSKISSLLSLASKHFDLGHTERIYCTVSVQMEVCSWRKSDSTFGELLLGAVMEYVSWIPFRSGETLLEGILYQSTSFKF